MIHNKEIKKLIEAYKTIWALSHFSALGSWDLETYMPSDASAVRGEAMAKIGTMIQSIYLSKEFINTFKIASEEEDLTDYEKGILRNVRRKIDDFTKLPPEFVEKFERLINQAQVAWRKAREKDEFGLFAPILQEIVDLTIQKTDLLGYENEPYDALLDQFEESLTTNTVKEFFEDIKSFLLPTLEEVSNDDVFTSGSKLANTKYDKSKLKKLCIYILDLLSYDSNRLRLDVSTHPFSENMGSKYDARITTRFEGSNLSRPITSTIHEFGHALYDMQTAEELEYTPARNPHSLGLHESQSRFWENIVGRGKPFLGLLIDEIKKLGGEYKDTEVDDLYKLFNTVKPGFIRVEADELTYHLHIMIRFEIERMLVNKEVKINELSELWNSKYKEYLGIEPRNQAEGVLQDIHWSMGAIGYFPTYSTGTILSATWKYKIEEDLRTNISDLAGEKEGIKKIKLWLKNNIHKHGNVYVFNDLISKVTGKSFETESWKKYITSKFISS